MTDSIRLTTPTERIVWQALLDAKWAATKWEQSIDVVAALREAGMLADPELPAQEQTGEQG